MDRGMSSSADGESTKERRGPRSAPRTRTTPSPADGRESPQKSSQDSATATGNKQDTREADKKRYGAIDESFKGIQVRAADEDLPTLERSKAIDELNKVMLKIYTRRKDAENSKSSDAQADVVRFLSENKAIADAFTTWEEQAKQANRPTNREQADTPPTEKQRAAFAKARAKRLKTQQTKARASQKAGPKGNNPGNDTISREARSHWRKSAWEDFGRRLEAAAWDPWSISISKRCLVLAQVPAISEIIQCGDLNNKAWLMIKDQKVRAELIKIIVVNLAVEQNRRRSREWILMSTRTKIHKAVVGELPLLKNTKYKKYVKSAQKALER